ncbi:MAG: 3-phosphoserine/phosphohydroxythreonine transaminase [Veillonellaceae bacterium]|nr:3-phosphoserine/phosphohydroxythreonine transaminase [Veillonellaceae bacterium]
MERVFNFNAGPAAMPEDVLRQAAAEMTDYRGTGMGVAELSHRSAEYDELHHRAMTDLRELLAIPDDYDVLFLQGGASHQFMMVPANLARGGKLGYADTGVWAHKAMEEAGLYGQTYTVTNAGPDYTTIPPDFAVQDGTDYVHITTNNTIYGTQYREFPDLAVPLVADMSSDILSRPVDVRKFDLIYAGAQKNLGPAGVTVVIVRKERLAQANTRLPKILQYRTHAAKDSLYNTPPTYPIYLMGLVFTWVKKQGGVAAMQARNAAKAARLYEVIDAYPEVFTGHAAKEARSQMNVTFNLKDRAAEADFIAAAKREGFVGIKGHRLVGGLRVSLYNAVTPEAVDALAAWLTAYAERKG